MEDVYPEELSGVAMLLRTEKGADKDDGSSIDSKESSATRRHESVSTPAENARGDVCREADVAVAYCPLANNAEQANMDEGPALATGH